MKLYRGLKEKEFKGLTKQLQLQLKSNWKHILTRRSGGDFSFPKNLSKAVNEISMLTRLHDQHFTDRKDVALQYAKSNRGLLLEINPSVEDVLSHFKLEFQNFSKRHKKFEVVYRVDGSRLLKMSRRWKLRTLSQ
jgi:hypothetical protein